MSKPYLSGLGLMTGAIIGVGVFSLPIIAARSGWLVLLIYFIVLGAIQFWLHKLYAGVVLSTKTEHRLPGYAQKYFGQRAKTPVLILTMLGQYGASLAYLIVGGLFLNVLLAPYFGHHLFFYTSAWFFLLSLIVYFGLKSVSGFEFWLSALKLATIVVVIFLAWSKIQPLNLVAVGPMATWFWPYGPVFFSVSGLIAINDVCEMMAKEKKKIASALVISQIISIAFMFIFVLVAVGVTGAATSNDTLSGLAPFLSPLAFDAVLLLGLLSITTAFLANAEATKEVYVWDFGVPKFLAWLLACGLPLVFYWFGLTNLTQVISLTGALVGGVLGMVAIWLAVKARQQPEKKSPISAWLNLPVAWGLSLLFVAGLAYEIWLVWH